MQVIFALIRAPFALIGAILVTIVYVPLYIVIAIAMNFFWLFIVPLSWLVFLLPIKFFEAAFKNHSEVLKSYIAKSFDKWTGVLRENKNELLSGLINPYTTIYTWLVGGSNDSGE
jgi:hypothetical protein